LASYKKAHCRFGRLSIQLQDGDTKQAVCLSQQNIRPDVFFWVQDCFVFAPCLSWFLFLKLLEMTSQAWVPEKKICIGRQLRHCPSVRCLGVRSNLQDYPSEDLELIRRTPKIYYPTLLLAEALSAMGKIIFPSVQTIRYAGDKIRQTQLFYLLNLPVPRTRIYYGPRQKNAILNDFQFPFVAKVPRNSSKGKGVSLIGDQTQLKQYLHQVHPAYIQEYLPIRRDLRVVILGRAIVHAYWREAQISNFRTNVAQGGRIVLSSVPEQALRLALLVSTLCGFDQVGLDLCEFGGRFYILEANMNFGLEGFKAAGLDFREILKNMVEGDQI
jgi:ribosomal protein S6--L-glutamate ligase